MSSMRSYRYSNIQPKQPLTLIASGSVPAEIGLTAVKGFVFNPGILRYEHKVKQHIGNRIIMADHGINRKFNDETIMKFQLLLGNWLVIPDIYNSDHYRDPVDLCEWYHKFIQHSFYILRDCGYFENYHWINWNEVPVTPTFEGLSNDCPYFDLDAYECLEVKGLDLGLPRLLGREVKFTFTFHGDRPSEFIENFNRFMEDQTCFWIGDKVLAELDSVIFAIGGLRKRPPEQQIEIISRFTQHLYRYFPKQKHQDLHIHCFGCGSSAKVIETMIRYGITSNDISTVPYIAGMGYGIKYDSMNHTLKRVKVTRPGQKIKKSFKDDITEQSLHEIERFKEDTLDAILQGKTITQPSLETFM